MKVTITIECTEFDEVSSHLSVIRKQLKKEFKKIENQDDQTYPFKTFTVVDDNCYGYHKATVKDTCP